MKLTFIFRESSAEVEDRYEEIRGGPTVVELFLDVFERSEFRGETLVINSPDLRNRRAFRMGRDTLFLQLSAELRLLRDPIVEACTHLGGLSVFFFPKNPQRFLECFDYGQGYYDIIVERHEHIRTQDLPWLSKEAADILEKYVEVFERGTGTVGCSFTHDAQLFCELLVE